MMQILKWGQILATALILIPNLSWAKKTTDCSRSPAQVENDEMSVVELQREVRIEHAHELLGKYYCHSAVRSGESVQRINSKIYAWTKDRLPKAYKKQYKKIAKAIIDESYKREFDPIFVMSVIQNESGFNPDRLGSLDEIGLMQLRPATAGWIAPKFSLKFHGKKSLHDPVQNIKLGVAYMDYLRDRFDSHAQLYLSAYNMGQRNVDKNVDQNIWPKEYASHVMHFYVEFYNELKDSIRKKARRAAA